MRKLPSAIALCIACLLCLPVSTLAWIHGLPASGPPTLTPGALAPHSQTPLMPNVSTDGPRCLDSTWGACDGTQHCIAPTSGTPVESCQPPQEFVTVSGSTSGGTATINYTSYASFIYPTGLPLIISGATQTNWNTPAVHVTAYTANATDVTNCGGGTSITLGLSANPFIVGKTIYVNGLTGTGTNTLVFSMGWSGQTAGNPPPAGDPNGRWTVAAVSGGNVTYCTTSNPTSGTIAVNQDGYYGTAIQPWTVSASACVGVNCSVSFLTPNACASACVSGTTQIAAGQFEGVIISPHFGEEVNFVTYTTGNATSCIIAKSIGTTAAHPDGILYAGAELNGGAYVQATAQTVDPRGAGVSGLSIAAVHPYCVKANVAALSDGEQEIRWIVCPVVGYCGQLTSVVAADATSGSPILKANNHALGSWAIMGLTYGPPGSTGLDSQFPAYDWRYNTTFTSDTSSGITGATAVVSGGQLNVTYPVRTSIPAFPAGQTIALFGFTTGTTGQCGVSAGSHAGTYPTSGVNTLTLTGTCNFPVGSTVNIAGIVAATSGLSTNPTSYTWNGTNVLVQSPAVNCVAGAGACTLNVPGLTAAAYTSGGTVNPNYNGPCLVAASPAPTTTTFSCSTLAAANATPATGGQLTTLGNEFAIVGGGGDNPAPYTPYTVTSGNVSPFTGQMNPHSIALIAVMNATIGGVAQYPQSATITQNFTGCPGQGACGRVAGATYTVWIWRKDAGIDERKAFGAAGSLNPNSSFFFFTNASGNIKSLRSHVDSWNTAATAGPCNEASPVAVGSPLTHYAGTYCATPRQAQTSLIASASTVAQTVTNPSGCLIFSAASNNGAVPLYAGEPVNFASGLDTTSPPLLAQWGLYWIKATGQGGGTGVTLSATPGGACLNEPAGNIVGSVTFVADLGFDSVLFECSGTCSNSNPEQYISMAQGISGAIHFAARGGWLNFAPNTADGASTANTSMWPGPGTLFITSPSQGGRGHQQIGSNQPQLQLSSAVSIGATPPIVTPTAASAASCAPPNAAHTCETLTFAAIVDAATKVANGAAYQAPTSTGSPGQSLVITGMTPSTWNCGTSVAAPCAGNPAAASGGILAANTTSVTFVNDLLAPGATAPSVLGRIIPTSLIMEVAPGTFSFDATLNPLGLCAAAATGISIAPSAGSSVCIAATSNVYNGTSAGLYPLFMLALNDSRNSELASTSNCLPAQTGAGAALTQTSVQQVIWSTNHATLNDIVVLSNNGSFGNAPLNAYNACGTGPFFFATIPALLLGTTVDFWDDSTTWTGPYWGNEYTGQNSVAAAAGTYYITNSSRFNTDLAFDSSSYAFGSLGTYNNGLCINGNQIAVSVNCQGAGPNLIPVSLGGNLDTVNHVPWVVVTGGLDATGAATLCGGSPCIGNTGQTDSGLATVSLKTTTPLTSSAMAGFEVPVVCGVTTLGAVGQAQAMGTPFPTAINGTVSPYTVTFPATTWTNSPCVISGSNAIMYFYNTRHIDFDFWQYSANGAPANGGGSYFDWIYWKDFIQENVTCNCGSTEGLFVQGGNIMNVAFEDSNLVVNQLPYPGGFSFTALGIGAGYSVTNFILRNDVMQGPTGDAGNGLHPSYTDMYIINNNLGVGANQTNFPSISWPSPIQTGFWTASRVAVNPAAGSTAAGGGWTNVAISPTATRATNAATGLPNVAAQQNANSFLALPWYGAVDSGLGTY